MIGFAHTATPIGFRFSRIDLVALRIYNINTPSNIFCTSKATTWVGLPYKHIHITVT